jgi:glucosamine-phosphate N-acetyltransferase
VATASLLIEPKFIRNLSAVGHIEDVVVDPTMRGKHLGKKLIEHLTAVAKKAGCYKVILDCNEENMLFYEKCGYTKKGVEMGLYF